MWHSNDHLLSFVSKNFQYKPSIAVLSFGNTLINEMPAKRTYHYPTSLKFDTEKVVEILTQIQLGGAIIVMENAFNIPISTIKATVGDFFRLIDNITHNIPIMFFFVLKRNRFKKPNTNIWKIITKKFAANGAEIDLSKCIYIGANAGRVKDTYPADLNDCDRALAANIGIAFKTPEQIFLANYPTRLWAWNDILSIEARQEWVKTPLVEPEFSSFIINQPSVIFITGAPSCGKTLLANRINVYINKTFGETAAIFDNDGAHRQFLDNIAGADVGKFVIIVASISSKYLYNLYFDNIIKAFPQHKIGIIKMAPELTIEQIKFMDCYKLQMTNAPEVTQTDITKIKQYFAEIYPVEFKFISYPLVIRASNAFFFRY